MCTTGAHATLPLITLGLLALLIHGALAGATVLLYNRVCRNQRRLKWRHVKEYRAFIIFHSLIMYFFILGAVVVGAKWGVGTGLTLGVIWVFCEILFATNQGYGGCG